MIAFELVFVGGEDWAGSLFMGKFDAATINDDYGVDGIDVFRLCFVIDRHICAC